MYENLRMRPEAIANRIINACVKKNIQDITNMKIQKLLYYVYGYFLSQNNILLFDEKSIMFWQHGPVIRDVYHSLKHFKDNIINEYIEDVTQEETENFKILDIEDNENTEKILSSINAVTVKLGHKTANELRKLSHSDNSVWKKITSKNNFTEAFLTEEYLQDMKNEINAIFNV
jgi:uncharacterized phage-associated protein